MPLLRRLYLTFSILALGHLAMAKDNESKTGNSNDTFTAIMSTKYDFGDESISAGKQAPDDFFLRGKQSQSLSQMVRLRSGFKREHRNSRAGVKALTH